MVYFAWKQMNAGWAIHMPSDAYANLSSPMRIRGIGVHHGLLVSRLKGKWR